MLNTFILNMPQRTERLRSVTAEFHDYVRLFRTVYIRPVSHAVPRISHWLTFLQLAREAGVSGLPCFIFCEDDHVFTPSFDEASFMATVEEADSLGADVLMGGVSWMKTPVQVRDSLFWLEGFNGTQFMVVFSRFYDKILKSEFSEDSVVTDLHISANSNNIFVVYPFVSRQKEFGYSDCTVTNNKKGYVENLFESTSRGLDILYKVRNFYHGLQQCDDFYIYREM